MPSSTQHILEVPSALGVTLTFCVATDGGAIVSGVDSRTGKPVGLTKDLSALADAIARQWFLRPLVGANRFATSTTYGREAGWTEDGYEDAFGDLIRESFAPALDEEVLADD